MSGHLSADSLYNVAGIGRHAEAWSLRNQEARLPVFAWSAPAAFMVSNRLTQALLWLALATQPTFASAGSLALTLAAWRCNIASLSAYSDLATYVTSPYMRASRW